MCFVDFFGPSVDCDSIRYKVYAGFASIMLLVYPIGSENSEILNIVLFHMKWPTFSQDPPPIGLG